MLFDDSALEAEAPSREWLAVGARRVPLRLVHNRLARRYILRLAADGAARVTVPRGGSSAEARSFAARNAAWVERQLLRQALRPRGPRPWLAGAEILFRGERVRLETVREGERNLVRFADQAVPVADPAADLRLALQRHLWQLACRELPPRVHALADLNRLHVNRVSVRNQRSRWGSCSRRGTISLNWRLIQAPPFVSDYLILHELAHLREMNHSNRFWREVERICPGFAEGERWLKTNAELLR